MTTNRLRSLDTDPYQPLGPDPAGRVVKPATVPGAMAPTPQTGVPTPISQVPGTGAPPPAPVSQTPGTGTTPPAPGTAVPPGTMPPPTYPTTGYQIPPQGPAPNYTGSDFNRQVTPDELVANQINQLLNSNSAYMRNARQRGNEQAASRGLLNSSIAAGTSQRAAIEAALPIASQDAATYTNAADRTFDAMSQIRQMRVAGDIQNWLESEGFNREFNGQLALMPIQSSYDMMGYIMQRAIEDPAVYTQDVISGMNNFFNQNMFDIMGRYFGTGSTPGGG